MKYGLTACLLALASSCGGANLNQRSSGNPQGGVLLVAGEIGVHPGGRYFVVHGSTGVMLGDMTTGALSALPSFSGVPLRLAFWPSQDGDGFFLLTIPETQSGEYPSETLYSYNIGSAQLVWSRTLTRNGDRLDVGNESARVILSGDGVLLINAADGTDAATLSGIDSVADLDLMPNGDNVIVTEVTVWTGAESNEPRTRVSMHSLATAAELCSVELTNCSSELALTANGSRAFLAPTTCRRDPVSVVDFATDSCVFVANLPGFGPVALAGSEQNVAVAFMDRDATDPQAPAMPEEVTQSGVRYHLSFIDVESLAYTTAPVGSELPRYAVSLDGANLIVDAASSENETVHLMPVVGEHTLEIIAGPAVKLNAYVLTPDANRVFLVDGGLYRLDITDKEVASQALTFVPTSINITPTGNELLLRDEDQDKVFVYDVTEERISRTLEYTATEPVL
jgi:hypothetical protein